MIVEYIKGDVTVLAEKYDVLVHGCNCFNTMGSGVAKAIATKWPGVVDADNRTIRGDMTKLGSYTTYQTDSGLIIVNAYTQYDYGRDGKTYFKYGAFMTIIKDLEEYDILSSIAGHAEFIVPRIGSGLGGGDWKTISWVLQQSPLRFTVAEL